MKQPITSKAFWADASKKTGTWAGVTAAVLTALVAIHPDIDTGHMTHWAAILTAVVIPALRGVLALLQGNIGDPDKASFAPAGPTVNVPADQLRDTDGDDPDDG